eukprot:CAMPEP_0174896978 /NCGR_PEP_ID=MMETSP0167-20121228/11156_1 /TAXON_ID=38298 /ORGANISM="Rhodella maculata, Strain CCMP736" /LENGTH=114 /DNA_ID=CAMNT_0016136681 /DNA_START=14 /DNA_END=358 /DNA_ORIENTATION=+
MSAPPAPGQEEAPMAPKPLESFEWGAPAPTGRLVDRYQFSAVANAVDPAEGCVWTVRARPKARRGEVAAPVARVVAANPAAILYDAWHQGKVAIETEEEYNARMRAEREKALRK